MGEIFIFLILQLVNVVLSTIKTIVTIKGNKLHAALANGVYFGYYTFIIKAIGNNDVFIINGQEVDGTIVIAIITIITNFVGVYLSLLVIEKTRKDKLWLLKVTIKTNQLKDFVQELHENNMRFITLSSDWEIAKPVDIYLYSKEETNICKSIMKKYDSIKYCSIEMHDDRLKI